jgi:hypothetical protein
MGRVRWRMDKWEAAWRPFLKWNSQKRWHHTDFIARTKAYKTWDDDRKATTEAEICTILVAIKLSGSALRSSAWCVPAKIDRPVKVACVLPAPW